MVATSIHFYPLNVGLVCVCPSLILLSHPRTCCICPIFLPLQVRFIEQYSQKGGQGGKLGAGGAGSKLHVVRVDGAGVPLQSEVGVCMAASTQVVPLKSGCQLTTEHRCLPTYNLFPCCCCSCAQAEAEQRAAARYQCGPLAFEIGGGAADATSSGNEGAKGGSGVQGALSSGGVRARAAGPRKVQAFCFPSDDT